MKTDELIHALQTDSPAQGASLATVLKLAFIAAILAAALAFFAMLGPRPDIAIAMGTMRFPFKFVVTVVLALSAASLFLPLARPGERGSAVVLLAAPAVVGIAALLELLVLSPASREAAWIGTNAMLCMTFIPLIGLGPLAIFLAALRYGAPTRPALAGAVAGVLAGGIAATFYAAHCTDDSPLFVATWYTLAITGLAVLGALAGRFLLRW
ncbi:MAG: NrsF family protein [Rhizobiaceae bacterium]|nr:NrsF family protein [Rhizobiaceae bacterium]